jgi:4-diphosphocytidyl-2-C-methyl-D-erythritol kinase
MTSALSWHHAPAKINLALHVTGQRADGYHLIETIAVFAGIGDRIGVGAAKADSFSITGPEAGALRADDPAQNLVIRARDMLRAAIVGAGRHAPPVALVLEKALPAGSGIGGGSADAAATLTALIARWNADDIADTIHEKAVELGADVPMCLRSRPLVARGVGEFLTPLAAMPPLAMVLVNPRRHVSTPAVFSALVRKDNPPIPIVETAGLSTARDWANWLAGHSRNDLQAPSIGLTPDIAGCLDDLRQTGPLLARMSGSGATCFGLYDDMDAAERAATHLLRQRPDWWITATETGPSQQEAP